MKKSSSIKFLFQPISFDIHLIDIQKYEWTWLHSSQLPPFAVRASGFALRVGRGSDSSFYRGGLWEQPTCGRKGVAAWPALLYPTQGNVSGKIITPIFKLLFCLIFLLLSNTVDFSWGTNVFVVNPCPRIYISTNVYTSICFIFINEIELATNEVMSPQTRKFLATHKH